jgi:hypothetical protein
VQGDVDVVLEPWPELQLVFPDLPELPAGLSLEASWRGTEERAEGGYVVQGDGHWSRAFLRPPAGPVLVRDRKATLPIGDGGHVLQLTLANTQRHGRTITLQPAVIVFAGSGPVEVRVPAAQVAELAAALQAAAKR